MAPPISKTASGLLLDTNSRPRTGLLLARLTDSPSRIWRSRLSWRIALSVFLTILTVQAGLMSVTVRSYEQARLDELTDTGRAAVVPLLSDSMVNYLSSPITAAQGRRLTTTTKVNGITLYSSDMNLLAKYGAPTVLSLFAANRLPTSYRSADGDFYEIVLRPHELGRPYYIVEQLDSSRVKVQVKSYIEQTILVMLLMSAFVTTVLMIALGRWLLEPILYLRADLLRASEDPEHPKLSPSPFDAQDDIGSAIELTQQLIRQNADNMMRIKSAAEHQIHKLAYFDALTGLPNRISFLQTLDEQAKKQGEDPAPQRLAVLAIDLDHFKDINDSMGHAVGDALLRAVGKRLRSALPESAMIARSGEDEFAVTLAIPAGVTAKDIGERARGVVRSEPFDIFNESFQMRVSIGVATFPDDGGDPDQVLKNADIALNRAKEDGRDNVKEYSEDFDRAVQQRFQMLRDLRDAMEHDQLQLYYQPQLDLRTGQVIGAEALLRWFKADNSKNGGSFISPADFVPIAEQSGLIVPIGEMVIREAAQMAAELAAAGRDIRIAINVSGAQFYQSDLVSYVEQVLKTTGVRPQQIELEVTESVFMEDVTHAILTLQRLHALGCELAIDDFGTGYSSLSYLRQFPIDRLKIDQSFIRNALNNADDAAIARTIVGLGHSLNMKVIAEGVETREHEAFLVAEGCDEVQGYRYSRPVPKEKFNEFIASYNGDLNSFA